MISPALLVLLAVVGLALAAVAAFLAHVMIRYTPIIARILEEKPVFLPLRVPAEPGGQDVRFPASDGLELAGTYYRTTADERVGVLVFCHEYLSDRRSFLPYLGALRGRGFDLFTFDFRNHGESATDPSYQPLQWVSDRELRDLRAALAYLRSRPDADPAGVGLFGVSRGGGTALAVASKDARVWGVITDGAFPTRGTMWAYIHRWAEIYVGHMRFWSNMPRWMFGIVVSLVSWSGRMYSQRRRGTKFPDIERAVSRLAPRPWLMIHGEKDAYIGPDIALRLFAEAGEPKEYWIVPKAKHNRCREVQPEEYQARLAGFLSRFAPRRPLAEPQVATEAGVTETVKVDARAVLDGSYASGSETRGEPLSPVGSGLAEPITG